ncbi:hypothetical protein CG476_022570 (plasmid) [Bacillus cytotoxicus]|nr:hypothetical protein CG476_022570 [Bacillus cytotoxicus]
MNMLSKVLTGVLSVSLIFNGVLTYNAMQEFDKKDKKYQVDIAKKDKTIDKLKAEMERLNTKVDTNSTDSNKEKTVSVIDLQKQYKDVSNQFIQAYLNYSVKNKNEREETIC